VSLRLSVLLVPMMLSCSASQSADPAQSGLKVQLADGPRLSAPRATHALVRASNGHILAIGGCVTNGCEAGAASATADIFSEDGRRLLSTGRLLSRRVAPQAAALADGRVLVLGGWVGRSASATTEIFDPRQGTSIPGPDMIGPRDLATVVVLADGKVLIAGGFDGNRLRTDAEIFDPATSRMSPVGPLNRARSGATGTLLPNGKVLIVGGGKSVSPNREALASAELFDPTTGTFELTGSLAQRRYKHGAIALASGDVLVVGGSDQRDYEGKLRTVERYDFASGQFMPAGNLAVPRFKLAGSLVLLSGERVLVAAGAEQPEIFDVRSGQGALVDASLGGEWNYLAALPLANTAAFLAGGYREGTIAVTDRSWLLSL
jgi:hypothetical protein